MKAAYHCFPFCFFFLFIRSKSLTQATFKGWGIRSHLLKGKVSNNFWTYFKVTTNNIGLYVLKREVVYYILYEKSRLQNYHVCVMKKTLVGYVCMKKGLKGHSENYSGYFLNYLGRIDLIFTYITSALL